MILETEANGKRYVVEVAEGAQEAVIEYARRELERNAHHQEFIAPKVEQWKRDFRRAQEAMEVAKEAALLNLATTASRQELALISEFTSRESAILPGDFGILRQLVPAPIIDLMHDVRSRMQYSLLVAYWESLKSLELLVKENK